MGGDLSGAVAIVLGFFAIAGLAGALFAYGRTKQKDETIAIYKGLNDALKEEREQTLRRVETLEVKVDLLESEWGDQVAQSVAERVVGRLKGGG